MKILIGVIFALNFFNANATEGYCHQAARAAAVEEALYEFPGSLPGASQAVFTEYSGFHQKEYLVTVSFKTVEPDQTYMVLVHEHETPETECHIDRVENITIEQ